MNKPKPLTDEQIEKVSGSKRDQPLWIAVSAIARAIEAERDAQWAARLEELVALLSEVASCFTRDDDLPDGLLLRIDAAITKEQP